MADNIPLQLINYRCIKKGFGMDVLESDKCYNVSGDIVVSTPVVKKLYGIEDGW